MKANVFTKKAMAKEFPWLMGIYNSQGERWLDRVDEIHIKRVDQNLLSYIPIDQSFDGSMGENFTYDLFYVVCGGQASALNVKADYRRGSNYAHSQRVETDGEKLICAIEGVLPEPEFIVNIFRDFSDWEGGEVVDKTIMTIYKPSKEDGFILKVIADYHRKAELEVKQAIDF
jgi:hypothetical protein